MVGNVPGRPLVPKLDDVKEFRVLILASVPLHGIPCTGEEMLSTIDHRENPDV